MNTVDNEAFANLILEARKAKRLTQKELGDKLFVSDKTISKWERSRGMPNIALLIPIAEALDLPVSTLLQKEKDMELKPSDKKEMLYQALQKKKQRWIIFCILSILITALELLYLTNYDTNFSVIKDNIYLLCGLMLVFGSWFTFFAKPLLPTYYDTNKVNFYAQGIFKLHMTGISFTNNNWYYICNVCKTFTLLTAPIYPILYICISHTISFSTYQLIEPYLICIILFTFLLSFYIIAKLYK